MAKKEKVQAESKGKFQDTLDQLNKTYGVGSILTLDNKTQGDYDVISTGSISFDYQALGVGGFVKGKMYELRGWESSGKSTICGHAAAECQKKGGKVVYIDGEHALDVNYFSNLGVDMSNMYISQPSSGEEGFMIAETTIKTGEVDLVVIDSDSSLIPKAVLTDGEIGDSSIGKKARLNSSAYPRLKAALVMNNVCVLVSSQYREKIGVMWGNPTTTQGGHALKYYADGIIEVSRVLTKEGEEIPGALVKIKVIKNKTFVPYKKGEFEIVFGKGIDFIKEIMTLGIEYEILKKAAGWYYFGEIRIERGESVVYKTLEDNPELLEEIREKIIEKIKGLTNEIKEEEISEDISSEV